MCVLAHVRIGGGEEIVKKMGLGDCLENGQVSVSSCLDSGSNYFIGLPCPALGRFRSSCTPVWWIHEVQLGCWADGIPGPGQWLPQVYRRKQTTCNSVFKTVPKLESAYFSRLFLTSLIINVLFVIDASNYAISSTWISFVTLHV